MKIGNTRVQGCFLADTWQRIYSHEVGINEGLGIYDKLAINFDGTDAATSHTAKTGQTVTFAGRAQLDTAQKKFGTASLLLNGGGIDVYTKLCSHFDGSDGATSYTDPIAGAYTFYDAAQLDTDVKKFGTASLFLNGTGDYVTLPDSGSWYFGTGDFTIDFWIRFSSTSGSQVIMGQYEDANNSWQVLFASGAFNLIFRDDGVIKAYYYTGNLGIGGGEWHHIALERTGTTAKIFLDGVSQTLNVDTAFGTNNVGDLAGTLRIGTLNASDSYFTGWLDEVRISNGIARWASDFTVPIAEYGTGDYVTLPDSDDWSFSTNPFTIDFWARYSTAPRASLGSQAIYSQSDGTSNWINITQSATALALGVVTSGADTLMFECAFTPAIDTWYHIAIVRVNTDNAATGWRIFINGVSQTLTKVAGAWNGTLPNISGVARLGGWYSTTYGGTVLNMQGWIDEVRVSNGIAKWTSDFTPPTAAYGVTSLTIAGLNGNQLQNSDFETWASGASSAPNGWTLYGAAATIAREATIIKLGTYSAKLTRNGTNAYLTQAIQSEKDINYWRGKTITFGAWVYATVASRVQLFYDDGINTDYSSYHTGDSTWQWLTITRTVNAAATILELSLRVITGDTSGYIDGAICMESAAIPIMDSVNIGSYCLNGNIAEEYRLVTRFINGYNGASVPRLKINNNESFGYQFLYGGSTTVGSGRSTGVLGVGDHSSLGDKSILDLFLYAKSGFVRTGTFNFAADISTTTVTYIEDWAFSWNNTVDNITDITLYSSQTNGLGIGTVVELYAKKSRI